MQRMLSYIRKAIDDYSMIEDGDKIAVGLSGGKDSITLLMGLKALQRFYDKKFDLIFFDAAKAQNIHFFTYFEKNLEKHGTIITDNIFFHGYTYMDPEKIESRNVRGIARKIRDYVSFLEENDSYETVIKKIGDGIAVTRRK